MSANKIIVTNLGALGAKYGAAGMKQVRAAVTVMITADAARGLKTLLVGLDDPAAMAAAGSVPVANATDPEQNKTAVDAVYNFYTPDYLMILGAVDVVPHQDLANPVYTGNPEDDPDPVVFSDLPYACPGVYGKSISAFKNPTRVVGRLPDVTGGNDPAYLVGLIGTAAGYTGSPAATYRQFFGVSAGVWQQSTSLSLQAAFGSSGGLKVVPPANSNWAQALLDKPSHFFNCHGAASSPSYYGQPANGAASYPVAVDAAYLDGKVKRGTVVAAEACYGAELYDPAVAGVHLGIPNQYLAGGAYGFFGSTTVAYGPSNSNDWADLICQYFFESILAGASTGRAALEARQNYIKQKATLTGTDLKTLAQYILLADPSVTPVTAVQPVAPVAHLMMVRGAFTAMDAGGGAAAERSARRQVLIQNGLAGGASVGTAETRIKSAPGRSILALLKEEAAKRKLTEPSFTSYTVKRAAAVATARTRSFKAGRAAKSMSLAEAVPLRELKAVHRVAGRTTAADPHCIGISGVEVHEFTDGVTVHPFESK